MQWRTTAETSPSSPEEAILLCSTEIIANALNERVFLSALVITRYAARVWLKRGEAEGEKTEENMTGRY